MKTSLVVGEGIETMLSLSEAASGLPVWAALSVGSPRGGPVAGGAGSASTSP